MADPVVTYCTDEDILKRDAFATRLLISGETTFDRHRALAKEYIDSQLALRDPPATAAIGDTQAKLAEVFGVLAMAYAEQASTSQDADIYWAKAKDFKADFVRATADIRGVSDFDDEVGSIGESIPLHRS